MLINNAVDSLKSKLTCLFSLETQCKQYFANKIPLTYFLLNI
jgi:hypothetical protein